MTYNANPTKQVCEFYCEHSVLVFRWSVLWYDIYHVHFSNKSNVCIFLENCLSIVEEDISINESYSGRKRKRPKKENPANNKSKVRLFLKLWFHDYLFVIYSRYSDFKTLSTNLPKITAHHFVRTFSSCNRYLVHLSDMLSFPIKLVGMLCSNDLSFPGILGMDRRFGRERRHPNWFCLISAIRCLNYEGVHLGGRICGAKYGVFQNKCEN